MYECNVCGKPDSLDRGGVVLCHNCNVRLNTGVARKATVKQVGGNHYQTEIDPIAFGEANLSSVEMNGFYKMNVIKYVARCDRKNGLEDLRKAQDYLNRLIKSYEDEFEDEEITELLRLQEEGKRNGKMTKPSVEESAFKEAELCVDRFHAGMECHIKRKDVLEIVAERLVAYDYHILQYGDGSFQVVKGV